MFKKSILIFLLVFITGCQTVSVIPTGTPVDTPELTLDEIHEELEKGLSGVYGVAKYSNYLPIANEVIRLGEVIWNEDKSKGNFVIDGAWSPSTISDENGNFKFLNVEPGEYIIILRDINTNPIIVADSEDANRAEVYTTAPDQYLNVGTIIVDPDS